MAPETIRVLIVDDHAVVREGLRAFLELQDGIEVVGEAADGEQAVTQAVELEPDVILMDLVMPRLDGIGAMRALRERATATRVIVLTSFLDDDRLMPALQAGAAGYLLKEAEPDELFRGVRDAASGRLTLAPRAARAMAAAPHEPVARQITEREREVLGHVHRGMSNKQIARELGITEKTVKAHLTRIFER
ncbi:MAG: response regulator, partial [Solirubrobacteraceae bacterium]